MWKIKFPKTFYDLHVIVGGGKSDGCPTRNSFSPTVEVQMISLDRVNSFSNISYVLFHKETFFNTSLLKGSNSQLFINNFFCLCHDDST